MRARRFAAAVLAIAVAIPAVAPMSAAKPLRERPGPDAQELRPQIVWKAIPFGDRRKRQMAGYSDRHYGVRSWRLTDPPVIVQHYTDGTSWQGAWNTFATNDRHNGEYPGTCTHFLIDTDGTIYQLVSLRIRCRHAVGMNHVSVGIEHVGTSDRMVLDNDRQMRASLRLTVWLMARYGVNVGNVSRAPRDAREPVSVRALPGLEVPGPRRLPARRDARVPDAPEGPGTGRGRPGRGGTGLGRPRLLMRRDEAYSQSSSLGRSTGWGLRVLFETDRTSNQLTRWTSTSRA